MKKKYSTVEISRSTILHNFAQCKKALGSGILAPVIKANGYGHGLLIMGQLCQESPHVDYMCVAYLSEGLQLRKAGITKPILVISCIDDDIQLAAQYTIDLFVADESLLHTIESAQPKTPIRLHLKIDTGLSRFGFLPHDTLSITQKITTSSYMQLQGVYTHFAQSNSKDPSFTHTQIDTFKKVLQQLNHHAINPPYIHAGNSAGSFLFNFPECNFFRVGIACYGWHSNEHVLQKCTHLDLRPALSWKTYIDQIKIIESGQYVGYDRTFQTKRKTRAAILPIGYYDGYDFRLANKGIVRINNHNAPVIGKVAMNVTMVDITDIPDAQKGDEVVLLGNYNGLTAHDLAHANGSKNVRESLVRINPTLPRKIID